MKSNIVVSNRENYEDDQNNKSKNLADFNEESEHDLPAGKLLAQGNVSVLGVLLPTPFSDMTLNLYEAQGDSETTASPRDFEFVVVITCFHVIGANMVLHWIWTRFTGL